MNEEKKEETKESGKKYTGGPIPKVSKAAQERAEKEASENK